MTARPLVIAYGNRLRGDDAVGWVVADSLTDDVRMDGADVIAIHQLTPELAEEVARASRVVFVDARMDAPLRPGIVVINDLAPDSDSAPMTHHVGAGAILSLADTLYGSAPPAFAVSVAIVSTESGSELEPRVGASVSRLVDAVVRLCGVTTHA